MNFKHHVVNKSGTDLDFSRKLCFYSRMNKVEHLDRTENQSEVCLKKLRQTRDVEPSVTSQLIRSAAFKGCNSFQHEESREVDF